MASVPLFTVFTKPWKQPLPELASHLRQMGFDGIELPVRPGFQVEPQSIARDLPNAVRILADFGLRIASIAGSTDERTIDACAEAGVPIIRTLVKVPPDGQYMTTMDLALRQFEVLAPRLKQARVTIGIQNHCLREVSSVMGLLYLVQRFDPSLVAAVLDVGHCGLAGDLPDLSLQVLWPHLCMVNFKNAYWARIEKPGARVAEFDPYWTTGRDGMANWPRFADELRQRDYAGTICLSAEYSQEQRLEEFVREDLAFARSLFAHENRDQSGKGVLSAAAH